MAKYNIIANSKLSTLSGIDTGNINLDYDQLKSLYDGNLVDNIVDLNVSDNLYLEVDFGYRIRLDSFNMYLFTVTSGILNNIDFYYKNFTEDTYTKLFKDYNGEFYYAKELPTGFAPINLLLTVSGVEGTLSEVVANNEDYSVSFGEEGDQTQVDISDSDSSNLSNAHILKIKNTSSVNLVDAYVCVDYAGNEEDFYLKISDDNEKFVGLADGVAITNDYISSNYRWSLGTFDNVKVTNFEQIELDVSIPGSVGTYTTQIISMEHENDCICLGGGPFNRNDSSFLITHTTGDIPNTSLKVDETDDDYTMEIRHSNVDPVEYTKLFYPEYSHISDRYYYYDVRIKDLYTEVDELFISNIKTYLGSPSYNNFKWTAIAVSDFDGRIATFAGGYSSVYTNSTNYNRINGSTTDQYGNKLIENKFIHGGDTSSLSTRDMCEFSRGGMPYLLIYHSKLLVCLNDELEITSSISYVRAFSVDLLIGSNSVWVIYSNSVPGVYFIDYLGVVLFNIPEVSAYWVAGNYDGGCWILENSTNTISKYEVTVASTGERSFKKTVETSGVVARDQYCSYIVNDRTGKDGLWYISMYDIIHIDKKGNVISGTRIIFLGDSLKANSLGVLVRRRSGYYWLYLDLEGNIISSGSGGYSQAIKTVTFKHCVEQDAHLLPLDEDPVWGSTGNLEWRKVGISGYFLPKTKYHQTRLTFRTEEDGKSPIVTSVVIPKPVVLKNIIKDQTKDLYLKTEFTGNEQTDSYASKLRCWWYIQED